MEASAVDTGVGCAVVVSNEAVTAWRYFFGTLDLRFDLFFTFGKRAIKLGDT